jgi:type IV pilus assembly protein PilE
MITVALVGILAAIALPSYREYVAKGRRAEARAVLLEAGQWMERHYSENYRYDQNTAGTAIATLFPANLSRVPRDTGGAYTVGVSAAGTRTFTITATRVSPGPMSSDACGNYNLTNAGVRSVTNYNTGKYASAADAAIACWR